MKPGGVPDRRCQFRSVAGGVPVWRARIRFSVRFGVLSLTYFPGPLTPSLSPSNCWPHCCQGHLRLVAQELPGECPVRGCAQAKPAGTSEF